MHIFIRDTSDVDIPEVFGYIVKRPLFWNLGVDTHWLRPYNSVHIILSVIICETITSWIQGGDFFTLQEVQRVDAGRTMSMSTKRVDIS